ncbi:MAG: hypothetical protein M3404_04390, partial [Actinomycetota bacterium]|nr:hypothetical protein [Actinomycetota bacterium]
STVGPTESAMSRAATRATTRRRWSGGVGTAVHRRQAKARRPVRRDGGPGPAATPPRPDLEDTASDP